MGQTACELSDRVIFTSDNPRTEDMHQILADMEVGLSSAAKRKYISVPDRREAIKTAVSIANGEDIILVAGKGHEKYQDIDGIKYPFDDKAILLEMFSELGK
jgi:UDP-N-acetylmuramoyl-L-alanyl-D-glutamate--2,6-diaminopimelate ligase